MKKIITLMAIMMVLMTMVNFVCLAKEVEPEDAGVQNESAPGTADNTNAEKDDDNFSDVTDSVSDTLVQTPTEYNDWLARIIEAFSSGNATNIVNLAFSVFTIIVMTVLKNGTKSSLQDMLSLFTKSDEYSKLRVNKLIDASGEITDELKKFFAIFSDGQTSIKNMVESQISELYNNVSERLENVERKVDVKTVSYEQVHAIAEGMKALNEMFLIVYQGSKTIPAATKEIVVEKSIQCTKALNAVEVNTDDNKN